MLAAIPGMSSSNSLNRRGPGSRACTTSRVQRSPTRARASASGDGARSRVADSRSLMGLTVIIGIDALQLSSKLQVTTKRERAMGALDGIQEEIRRVADQVSNAVVGIGQRWGVGSGVVLGMDQVLTN